MCGECGLTLNERADLSLKERTPCPACGSKARKFRVVAESGFHIEALSSVQTVLAQDVQSIGSVANLMLQTVVVPGSRTTEGQLIEAVTTPWFAIIEILKHDPPVVFQIPARKLEEMIAGAYQVAGFDEVILTPRSGDLGRDVIAIKRGVGSVRVIDQVKAYRPDNLVTANDVRALIGVLHGDGASKGFITTTSDFAPLLPKDPLIMPFIPSRLELINGKALIARLEELARKRQG